MGKGKERIYIVKPIINNGVTATRLIRGTLKAVESKLRGEVEVRPATPEECHEMSDVEIEDASGEPA